MNMATWLSTVCWFCLLSFIAFLFTCFPGYVLFCARCWISKNIWRNNLKSMMVQYFSRKSFYMTLSSTAEYQPLTLFLFEEKAWDCPHHPGDVKHDSKCTWLCSNGVCFISLNYTLNGHGRKFYVMCIFFFF